MGFACVRAHWLDLGAKDPGYVLDSTDMHQEGLIFPGTKIVQRGVLDHEIIELIRFNSRMPDLVIGDMHAQIAALPHRRAARCSSSREVRSWTSSSTAVEEILDHGERLTRPPLAPLPEGTWTAVDWLDDDGITDDPMRMEVTVTIDDDAFVVDFAGSAPATCAARSTCPFGAHDRACARSCFKALTTPNEPANAGHYRAARACAPTGQRCSTPCTRRRRSRCGPASSRSN